MASLIPESEADVAHAAQPAPQTAAQQFDVGAVADRAEQRINKRSRRMVTNVGPLGWWIADVSVTIFSAMLAYSLTPYPPTSDRHASALLFAAVLAVFVGVFSHIFGFHDRRHVSDSNVNVWRMSAVVALAIAATVFELITFQFAYVGRYILACSFIVSVVGMSALRIVVQHFSESFAQTVCFVGDEDFCRRATQFVEGRRRSFLIRQCPGNSSSLPEWAVEEEIDQLYSIRHAWAQVMMSSCCSALTLESTY